MMFAETARLWPFVSEHRANVIQFDGLRQNAHAVHEVRTEHRRSSLWPEGQRVSTAVFERIHLAVDIGVLTRGVGKQRRRLEHRGFNASIPTALSRSLSRAEESTPGSPLFRHNILGAARN